MKTNNNIVKYRYFKIERIIGSIYTLVLYLCKYILEIFDSSEIRYLKYISLYKMYI